ncbi:MAG TPA: DUF4836 family protein [Bacteroidales bacterium]|nr:DUF4836 family protein [Bacteroidales bacterium]
MFQKIIIFVCSSFLGIFLFSSCSQVPKHAQYIPSDAAFVGVVDIISIAQKGKLQDAKSLQTYKNALDALRSTDENTAVLLESLVNDPQKSGIDVFSDLFVFSVLQNEKLFACVSVKLDSKENFQNLMEGFLGDEYDLQEQEGVTYYTNETNSWIAFNNQTALFISSIQAKPEEGIEFIQRVFTQTKSESIVESKEFTQFYERKKDVSFWISSTHIIEGLTAETKSMLEKNLESFQGLTLDDVLNNYIHIFLNFEDDAITLDFNLEANDAFKAFLEKTDFSKDKIAEEIFAYFPQTSYFLLTYAFDSDKLISYLQGLPDYKQIEADLKQQGISVTEFISALNGDVMLSIYNASLEIVEKKQTLLQQDEKGRYMYIDTIISDEQIIPKGSLVISLKNESYIQSFITKNIPADMYTKQESYLDFSQTVGFPMFVGTHNNMLMISTDAGAMSQFYEGGYAEAFTMSDLSQEIDGSAFYYLNLDIESYPIQVKEYINKSFLQHIIKPYYSTFQSLTISSNGKYSGRLQILLKNDKENSLYQVLQMLDSNNTPQ